MPPKRSEPSGGAGSQITAGDSRLETQTTGNAADPSDPPATNSTRAGATPRPRASVTRGRGGRLLSQPKFTGRRSAAARQELEKAEAEKKRAEQAAKAAAEASGSRRGARREDGGYGNASRGRGRGRGGYAGESNQRHTDVLASGPFSAGQAAKGLFKSPSNRGGRTGSGHTSGALKSESKAGHGSSSEGPSLSGELSADAPRLIHVPDRKDVIMEDKPYVRKTEDGGYISSDEEDDGSGAGRLNVENLTVIDLTRDGETVDSYTPVRVARVAHKDRVLGINADGALTADKSIAVDTNDVGGATSDKRASRARGKDVEVVSEKQRFMSVYEDASSDAELEPAIKADPDTPDARPPTTESVQEPESVQQQEPPTSPERNRKIKDKLKSAVHSATAPRPSFQTQEEMDEWDRAQEDLEIIRSELGGQVPVHKDADGDTAMADAEQKNLQVTAKRDNKVYLFQFPPILPDLTPVNIKPDPEAGEAILAPNDGPSIANDTAVEASGSAGAEPTDHTHIPSKPRLPPGHVGKLRIHASGRATLDWGGTSLSLGMGARASFLQDIVVARLPEGKLDGTASSSTEEEAVAMSMGQVKGKFIVTPDWEKILS